MVNIYHIMLYSAHISVMHAPSFHFCGDFCDFCGDFGDFIGDFSDFGDFS